MRLLAAGWVLLSPPKTAGLCPGSSCRLDGSLFGLELPLSEEQGGEVLGVETAEVGEVDR